MSWLSISAEQSLPDTHSIAANLSADCLDEVQHKSTSLLCIPTILVLPAIGPVFQKLLRQVAIGAVDLTAIKACQGTTMCSEAHLGMRP